MVKARVVLARTLLPFCVGFGLAGETHAQQAAAPSAASDADIPAPTPSGTNGLLEKTPAQTPEPPQTVVPEPMPSRNQQPLRSANPEASASAAAIVPPPVQHRRFADWSTTRHQNPGQVVCFALGKPRSSALTARETEQPAAAESLALRPSQTAGMTTKPGSARWARRRSGGVSMSGSLRVIVLPRRESGPVEFAQLGSRCCREYIAAASGKSQRKVSAESLGGKSGRRRSSLRLRDKLRTVD